MFSSARTNNGRKQYSRINSTFSRVMYVSTGDGVLSTPLLSNLPWSPNVIEVAIMVVAVILKQDVNLLEGDMAHMVVDIVALIKDHVNADIVGKIIIFLRSTGRNLITLNGHS